MQERMFEHGNRMDKISFALKSILKSIAQRSNCPYCKSNDTRLVERKHYVLQLRRCRSCRLRYRFPKDDMTESGLFYQEDYQQSTVTDLPPPPGTSRSYCQSIQGYRPRSN